MRTFEGGNRWALQVHNEISDMRAKYQALQKRVDATKPTEKEQAVDLTRLIEKVEKRVGDFTMLVEKMEKRVEKVEKCMENAEQVRYIAFTPEL